MKHNRPDYDSIQPWPTKRPHIVKDKTTGELVTEAPAEGAIQDFDPIIPDDEPVFLLRAKDPHAAEVVRYWAWKQLQAGADPELVSSCARFADEMEEYRDLHYARFEPDDYADVPDPSQLRA